MELPLILQQLNRQQPTPNQPQPQSIQLSQQTQSTNFENTKSMINILRNANNPLGLLQTVVEKTGNPIAKTVIDLNTKYNGNCDLATAELIKEYNLNPDEVKSKLHDLGII